MKRSFLDNHYDSILTANREKILAGGNGDAFLGNALTDSRMALVVLIRIPSDAAEKINRCIDDLKGIPHHSDGCINGRGGKKNSS